MSKTRLDNIAPGRHAKLWDERVIRVDKHTPGGTYVIYTDDHTRLHISRATQVTPCDAPNAVVPADGKKSRACRNCGQPGHYTPRCPRKGDFHHD